MATPVINNGIFLRDNQYVISNHLDSAHLYTLLKNTPATDLGPVDLFAFAKKTEAPLYTFASLKNNVIYVDNPKGEYTWQVPVAQDLNYVVEDIDPNNTAKGIGGTPFKVKFNKPFSHNEIITYDKFNGIELYVTEDDIIPVSDGYIHTVRIVNNDNNQSLSNVYLAPQTKWFVVGNVKGEFSDKYTNFRSEAGYREFYNYVGTAEATAQYSISSRAEAITKGLLSNDGTKVNVLEIWRVFDSNLDPSITSLNDLVGKMGVDYVKNLKKAGKISSSFVTKIEAMAISKIMTDIENYLMWGKGGRIQSNIGADDIRMTAGFWKQTDRGYKYIYNYDSFTIDMFRSEIFNYFAGKVDFKGPDPQRQLIVHTGMGGYNLIQAAIDGKVAGSGLQLQAAENAGIGAVRGKAMDLTYGYAYTGIVFPFLANVKFVLNPTFDNYNTNDIENPIVNGYPLSSYSFIIFDVTDGANDNIYLLKWKHDHELQWFYQNGDMDYLGRKAGFQSSGLFSGYKVFMKQRYPAIWVKDPSRIMKFVMKNPYTGNSL